MSTPNGFGQPRVGCSVRIPRAFGVVLLALALLPATVAAKPTQPLPIDLVLPAKLSLSEATLVVGHLDAEGLSLSHAQALEARAGHLGKGSLTVCPVRLGGQSRSALETVLSTLNQGCLDGQTFQDPQLRFGQGTGLEFNGTLGVSHVSSSSLAAPFADPGHTLAMLLSDDGLALTPPKDGFWRFAPTSARSSIAVLVGSATTYYNGTDFAVVANSPTLDLSTGGFVGSVQGTLSLTVSPGSNGTLEQALRPFALLDLEEAALGPDAREPRGNVSAVFREFGRVPSFIDGAVEGRLNGTFGGLHLDGRLALVRATRLDLHEADGHLVGTGTPVLVIASRGVAFGGVHPASPPWVAGIVLWAIAVVVLLVRRHAPARRWMHRATWLAAAIAALYIVDRTVLLPSLGTSALQVIGHHGSGGAILALTAFEVVLVVAAYLLLALPARLVAGRLAPKRFLWAAEGLIAFVWILLPLLFAASFFALAYAFARL